MWNSQETGYSTSTQKLYVGWLEGEEKQKGAINVIEKIGVNDEGGNFHSSNQRKKQNAYEEKGRSTAYLLEVGQVHQAGSHWHQH